MEDLDRLKSAEARRPGRAENATAPGTCKSCGYLLHTEQPILNGYNQVGAVCTCVRCGEKWETWRKDSYRLAHVGACSQRGKDMDHG